MPENGTIVISWWNSKDGLDPSSLSVQDKKDTIEDRNATQDWVGKLVSEILSNRNPKSPDTITIKRS